MIEHTKFHASQFLSADELIRHTEIVVDVEALLGVIEMSLDDLVDLSEGQVFEYCFDPSVPVQLKVGTERIATAKFVSHQGMLCLQITAIEEGT